jgi:repressor of nif and glnA expression
MNMIFTTLTFYMAVFHKKAKSFTNTPSDAEISKKIDSINEIIERGIGYIYGDISALDYGGLENRVEGTVKNLEDDPLLRAVAVRLRRPALGKPPWNRWPGVRGCQKAAFTGISRASGICCTGFL